MRDSTHNDFIERWAKHVKTHPEWKKEHTQFINAQYEKHLQLVKKLSSTTRGKETLKKLYNQ